MSDADDRKARIVGSVTQFDNTRYESQLVQLFLRKLLPKAKYEELKRKLGRTDLNLEMLYEAIPGFPLHLVGTRVYYLAETSAADLFMRFWATPLAKAFFDTASRMGWNLDRQTVGLVTRWPDATTVVLHNWPRSDDRIDKRAGHVRFTATHNRGENPLVVTLESVDSLLDAMERLGICQTT